MALLKVYTKTLQYHPDYAFWCPGCNCLHVFHTLPWMRDVEDKVAGPVWKFNGNMEKPTFDPSLLIRWTTWVPPVDGNNQEEFRKNPWEQKQVEKVCHLRVTNGKLEFCGDCTHDLRAKTIPMVDIDHALGS